MTGTKDRWWAACLGLFLAACLTVQAVFFPPPGERLSQGDIARLRHLYPVYGEKIPATASMSRLSLDQRAEGADTFVYGVVTGKLSAFAEGDFPMYGYVMRVIEDTEGLLKPGSLVALTAPVLFQEYNGPLQAGARLVVPWNAAEGNIRRNAYQVDGVYYVTDGGYVLSAFDEPSRNQRERSGLRVQALLAELKK